MPFLEASEFQRRLERHAAWHRRELVDGPLVLMSGPADEAAAKQLAAAHEPPSGDPDALQAWWTDPAQVIPRIEESLAAQAFYGDAVPAHFLNLGPGALAAFMGCRSVPHATTVWQLPLIEDWAAAPELRLQEDNLYWQAAQALTRAGTSASRGRWITSLADIGGVMDITSYFRTPEKLCLDLIEHPADVRRAEEAVLKAWFEVYDRLYPLVMAESGGTCGWMRVWYPGRGYPMQCDFSCMISPAMFRAFALPMLQRQAAGLDVAVYHLDGPNAIRHLDAICTVPNIAVIQWTPGSGSSYEVADWLDLYRRVLARDRGLLISCSEEGLDLVFSKLDPDRAALWIAAPDARGRERIMAKVERLRRRRKRVQ